LEKSDKFSKIPCFLDILEYNFTLTHMYSKIESYFTSGKMTYGCWDLYHNYTTDPKLVRSIQN
jgi:hypothetical protein